MAQRHVCDSTGGPSQHHFLLCTASHCVKAAHVIRPSTQTGSLPGLLLLRVVLLTAFSYVTSGEEIRALPLGVGLSTGKTRFSVSGHFPTVLQSGGTHSHCHQQHDISRCPHPCRRDASPGRCHSGGYEGCSDSIMGSPCLLPMACAESMSVCLPALWVSLCHGPVYGFCPCLFLN